MRMTTLAISGALIACVAATAAAAPKGASWKPTYSACEALAVERGVVVNERGQKSEGPSPYRQFMVECLAGKVEGKPVVAARIAPAPRIPEKWDGCEQLALKRGIDINERGRTEEGSSPFGQFMRSCMQGKVR
jgi:cytochrome c5